MSKCLHFSALNSYLNFDIYKYNNVEPIVKNLVNNFVDSSINNKNYLSGVSPDNVFFNTNYLISKVPHGV